MRIDFHTHGKLAKKLPFSTKYTDLLFKKAKNSGLDAICLTEHFNTLQFDKMYHYIYEQCDKVGDCCITKEGLKIFFGMEVDIKEGGHTLVIGKFNDILKLNQLLENNKTKDTFLSFDELISLYQGYNVIFGAAHPFREKSHIPELSDHQLKYFDFIDLNGKDLANDLSKTKESIYQFAGRLNKPIVSGSDTHQATQYGCVYTCLKNDVNYIDDLRKEIKEQNYYINIAESIYLQVEDANFQKRLLKEIHRLGGDYVSML